MRRFLKILIRKIFKLFNVGILNYGTLEKLREKSTAAHDLDVILNLPKKNTHKLLKYLRKSKSQIKQDLFVLSELNFKTNGFFVEFGATNGIDLSNTYLLEKEFGWSGILAEPAKYWHSELKRNRTCTINTHCVWKNSISSLIFYEADATELSTINDYKNSDLNKKDRKNGKAYRVKTISLNDLLKSCNAPKTIDYLSIDTEGSEYEILSNFDFSKYTFKVITCEHNFTPMRAKIYRVLKKHGYLRVYKNLSLFDDWYVKKNYQVQAPAARRASQST
jgi:FkbM family methyltransferase